MGFSLVNPPAFGVTPFMDTPQVSASHKAGSSALAVMQTLSMRTEFRLDRTWLQPTKAIPRMGLAGKGIKYGSVHHSCGIILQIVRLNIKNK